MGYVDWFEKMVRRQARKTLSGTVKTCHNNPQVKCGSNLPVSVDLPFGMPAADRFAMPHARVSVPILTLPFFAFFAP
jgi:hypothetical protein